MHEYCEGRKDRTVCVSLVMSVLFVGVEVVSVEYEWHDASVCVSFVFCVARFAGDLNCRSRLDVLCVCRHYG